MSKPILKLFIFSIMGGFFFIFVYFMSSKKVSIEPTDIKEIRFEKKIKNKLHLSSVPSLEEKEEIWTNWFENQAQQISHLVDDPTTTQKNLQEIALAIPQSRLGWLRNIAKNDKLNTDQRLLAIEYLSLNPNLETLDALEDVASSHTDENNRNLALKNESLLLKAAAIEGLATKEISKDKMIIKLKTLSNKIDDKFLLDRINRSIWHIKGIAHAPEAQDIEALGALLKL